jgi:quinol monooxygenase YgiN
MTFVLTVRMTAKEGEEENIVAAFRELAPASRAEPGCLAYQPHRDPDDPRVFFVYEQYADEDAFKAHGETDHFQRHAAGDLFPRLEARERSFYETLDV